jgi:hypothetical protein
MQFSSASYNFLRGMSIPLNSLWWNTLGLVFGKDTKYKVKHLTIFVGMRRVSPKYKTGQEAQTKFHNAVSLKILRLYD